MQSVPITGGARFIGQPYQHPEKLIPLMIIHALEGKPLPSMATAPTSATGCTFPIIAQR
jgi:hypothetical protein